MVTIWSPVLRSEATHELYCSCISMSGRCLQHNCVFGVLFHVSSSRMILIVFVSVHYAFIVRILWSCVLLVLSLRFLSNFLWGILTLSLNHKHFLTFNNSLVTLVCPLNTLYICQNSYLQYNFFHLLVNLSKCTIMHC